jgi:hypothetical protein
MSVTPTRRAGCTRRQGIYRTKKRMNGQCTSGGCHKLTSGWLCEEHQREKNERTRFRYKWMRPGMTKA